MYQLVDADQASLLDKLMFLELSSPNKFNVALSHSEHYMVDFQGFNRLCKILFIASCIPY